MRKKKILYAIVTSKDKTRSKLLSKKFKLKPASIHSPSKRFRGKPWPDLIDQCVSMHKRKIQNTYFVGDTNYDYVAAKRAGVKFIFADYGYGKFSKKYLRKINKIEKLIDCLEFRQN